MYKKLFGRPAYALGFPTSGRYAGQMDSSVSVIPILIKIMKFSLLQILGIALAVQFSWSTPANAQLTEKRISIEFTDQKLEKVLKTIANKAQFRLVYNDKLNNSTKLISGNYSNTKIKDILDRLLSTNQLMYEVVNDQFVVIKGQLTTKDRVSPANTSGEDTPAETKVGFTVSGKITDENNVALPGVTIRVKDGSQMVTSNAKGRYTIGVSTRGATLQFAYVGYKTYEKIVNDDSDLDVELKPDPAKLDEVVIIGYGTTTKRTSTGSQSGISAKELEKQPITNVLQALQGRLPGVQVSQTNGLPGGAINVQIRGANSLGKSNRPLYIIDGVPFLSEPINTTATTTSVLPSAEGATSPMNSINPADIENIEVLKDADATAIYGSRGANGVVLITTKRGQPGKTKFNLNVSSGASVVTRFADMMKTDQYLALRKKAFANGTTNPATPNATNAPDLLLWDQNADTDWQRLLLGNTAKTHDVTANVSGGEGRTSFYISGTYHKEGNVYPGDQGYQRGGLNASINHTSLNQRFTLGLSTMFSTDKNSISTTELGNYAYNLPPNYPLYNLNGDGKLYWVSGLNNPYGFLNQTNDNRSSNLLGSLNLKYTILKGLDIKSTFGYNKADMKQVTLRPLSSLNPTGSVRTSGTAAYAYTYSNNYIIEPQITYDNELWKGKISLLAGGTYQYKQSQQPYYTSASSFTSDDFLRNVNQATEYNTSSSSSNYKYTSLFGRINYNVENKYILNLNYRRDGSSRFGPNKKFGTFGSAGAAWVFSEENFLKNKISFLSFGKLRSSYGVAGSDEIGDYQYLASFAASSAAIYNGSSSLVPSRIANSDFKWESTKKFEVALELGFFNDRLSLTSSYYNHRSGNQLITYPLSSQTGFSGFQSNLPATVQNSGAEFSLTSVNIKSKYLTWNTSFNISKNSNKLISFPDIEKTSYYTTYLVGKPISANYAYQYIGIDPATNFPAFTDFNGVGGTASPTSGFSELGRGDRYYAGTLFPTFFGGITNSFTYKGINLDFTFQFVKQEGRSLARSTFYPPGYMYNAAASVVNDYLSQGSQDYLVTAGLTGTNGRTAYFAFSNWAASDANIVDASFIRMKNVSLSYVLPGTWLKAIHVDNVRIFTQGQNLFTVTGYKGIDPESQGVGTPPLRTIIAGLQLTL
ncbi:MAG: SusC/RagA family TonB-linked outer membrane protein [Pedobacter sp.]|uniref:SusC/RagA family TonB-linked outer membrane protein n=1 Tax=Pedobacter sp. TaxID=1411316 RepID=UPI003396D58B